MDQLAAEVGERCGFGEHVVSVIPHFPLKLSDGIFLSLKIWFPSASVPESFQQAKSFVQFAPKETRSLAPEERCPVVLEHLPYRKSDWTLPRDYQRHTWMCSHGYVVVRSDLRGSGDSEGFCYDEYEEQELNDACEIIAWCASQSWCNGRVGMYGKSWGGFNGLQVAFKQPEALKAVVTLYSTDDRYATDVHYMGGCLMGVDMIGWASIMSVFGGRPPHPNHAADWKELWLTRLQENQGPLMNIWLAHQTRDEYWRHGSVCEEPKRIQIPVLAIGGFNDGYRDAVLRMARTLPVFRGIIGPWCHDWPDCSKPGPHIEFMLECKAWWDEHLKEIQTQVMDAPLLRVFLQDSIPPSAAPPRMRDGRWVKMNSHESGHEQLLIPDGTTGKLLSTMPTEMPKTTQAAYFSAVCGMLTNEWNSFGDNSEAGDQRSTDAHSLCWTSDVLGADVNVLGNPELNCLLSSDKDQASIAVRLVDVFPDGRSTLITFGVLNLTHREGHGPEAVKPLVPGETYKVTVQLRAIAYVIPRGHRIRLAVSPAYFPMIWPSREKATLQIATGRDESGTLSALRLPVCTTEALMAGEEVMKTTESPKLGPPLPTDVLRPPSYERYAVHGLASPVHKFIIDADAGRMRLKQTDTVMDSRLISTYSLEEEKPLSAAASVEGYLKIEYPNIAGGVVTNTKIDNKVWCDFDHFHSKSTVSILLNDELIHTKTWQKAFPRVLV